MEVRHRDRVARMGTKRYRVTMRCSIGERWLYEWAHSAVAAVLRAYERVGDDAQAIACEVCE